MDVSGNYWKTHNWESHLLQLNDFHGRRNKTKQKYTLLWSVECTAQICSNPSCPLPPLSVLFRLGTATRARSFVFMDDTVGLFMQIRCQLYPPSEPFAYYMMKTTKPRQEAHPCWEEAAISVCRAALSANSQSMSHTVLQHPDELFQNWRGPFTDCERQILWNHWTSFSVRVSTFILKILRSRGE